MPSYARSIPGIAYVARVSRDNDVHWVSTGVIALYARGEIEGLTRHSFWTFFW